MNLFLLLSDRRKSQKGQSLVEISLITPILLIALYIPADFGIAFFMGNMLATAARDGARVGSELEKSGNTGGNKYFNSADATEVKNATFARMPDNVRLTNRKVLVTFYEGTNCMHVIEVTAQADYNYFLYQILRLFGASVANTTTISRTTQLRYTYQPFTFGNICVSAPEVDHVEYTS
jgi:Flp pilus assembly protein TadG